MKQENIASKEEASGANCYTKRKSAKYCRTKSYLLPLMVFQLVLCINASAQQDKNSKKDEIKPGKRQAILILSDGKTIQLSEQDSLNYTTQLKSTVQKDSTQLNSQKNLSLPPTNTNKTEPLNKKKKAES